MLVCMCMYICVCMHVPITFADMVTQFIFMSILTYVFFICSPILRAI